MDESEIEKRIKEYEEWENSLEGIRYSLGVCGDVTVEDDLDMALICMVLQKIPKEIRELVQESVIFILSANKEGTLFSLRLYPSEGQDYVDQVFILLKLGGSKKRKMVTIAHEIAHFYLDRDNEYGVGHAVGDQAAKGERVADDLIESWGFGRAYKSYEQFIRSKG